MTKFKRKMACIIALFAAVFACALGGCSLIFGEDSGSAETYKILYIYNNSTYSMYVDYGSLWNIEQVPEKEGYTFIGYFDAEEGGTQYTSSSGVGLTAFYDKNDIVLYPHFTEVQYTVMLNYGESFSTVESVTASYNGAIPNLPKDLTIAGKGYMTFKGWYTEANGGGIQVAGSDGVCLYSMDSAMRALCSPSNVMQLYAYFETQVYTIQYTYNGETSSVNVTHGDSWSLEVPVKEGYTFNGFYDAEIGGSQYTGADGVGLEAFVSDNNLVLYPHFTIITYTLSLNYGEGSGYITSVNADYDGTIPNLPAYLAVTGKTFVGWYTGADGSGIKVAGDDGKALVTMDADMRAVSGSSNNLTLYAYFETNIYIISYTYEGTDYSTAVTYGASWSLAAIKKEGYIFEGYYDAEEGGTQYAGADGKGLSVFTVNKDLVLYPHLTIITYTLVLDYGESTGTVESVTADYNGTIPDLPADLVIDGKGYMAFTGWYTAADGSGIQVAGSDGVCLYTMDGTLRALSNSSYVLQLYACFQSKVYTIQYTYNDNTVLTEVKHGESWSLDVPEKEGYTFDGLFDAEEGGTQYTGSDGKSLAEFTADKDLVLYPHLTIITYTLVLDYGESAGTVESVTADYDGTIPDLPADLTIDGKGYMTFIGWYTEANGGGTQVAGSNGKALVTMDADMRELSDSSNNIQLYVRFETHVYTITYTYNDETTSVNITHGESWSLEVPEKEGYIFEGYFDAETDGTQYTGSDGKSLAEFTADSDLVLYPRLTIITYTLLLDYGESVSTAESVTADYDGTIPDLPANLTVDGKGYVTFAGWYTEADGSGIQVAGSDGVCLYTMDGTLRALSNSSNELQLYAYFPLKVYTIQYTYNGSTVSTEVTHGSSWSLTVPVKEGYTFNGFYDAENGGTQYTGADGKSLAEFTADNDLVLYPCLTIITYTLILNYGESSGTVESVTADYDGTIPDLPADLTIDGKWYMSFAGWYTKANGSGIQVAASSGKALVTMNSALRALSGSGNNIQLYAVFKMIDYTVTFYEESGTYVLYSTTAVYGTAIADIDYGIIYNNKYVSAWTTEIDGSTVYNGVVEGNLNLYAASYSIKITFDSNGADSIDDITVNDGTYVTIPSALTLTGYTFAGWYDASGKEYSGSIIPTGNLALMAKWTANTYMVNLNADGGTVSSSTCTLTYGSLYTLAVPELTGYTFGGWYYENTQMTDSSGVSLAVWSVTSDVTLTAKWTVIYYTISLDADGGKVSTSSYKVTYGSTYTLAVPTRTGYTFGGWYYEDTQMTNSSGVSLSDWESTTGMTLTAKWTANTYTVNLNADGGTVSTSTYTLTYDSSYTLAVPTRTGYTFGGWYYNSTQKTNSSGVSLTTWNTTSDVTLTAKWTVNTYTITLNANNGTVSTSTYTVTYGSTYTLAVPSRSGYAFNGWYNSSTQMTDRLGASLSAWSSTSNMTLKAKWTKLVDYEVSLDRASCALDNGFKSSTSGTDIDILAHGSWDLIDLVISGCAKDSSGNYYVPDGNSLTLYFNVLQDLDDLPTSNLGGASVNWTVHYLSNDSYTGSVSGTNISGKQIGYGAYYVKVNYTDGTYTQSNAVNFLKDASEGDLIELSLNINSSKTISSIEVVAVYELYYDYMNSIWDWNGTKCYSNWRASTTIVFS